ncbi:hypothetical protein AX15_007810, partial [Amanita polypyramis BW_CC]
AALNYFHAPGSTLVNRPTTASLKFTHVLTIHLNGLPVTDGDLLAAIKSHPCWQSVSLVSPPCFIHPTGHALSLLGLVFIEVMDSHASSTACSLLKTSVNFFGTPWYICRSK